MDWVNRVLRSRRISCRGVVLVAVLAPFLTACAAGRSGTGLGSGAAPLSQRLDRLLGEVPFDRVHWGVLAVDALSGRVLFERNPDLLFIPGSNMKIPVAAAAMGILGPDYRWQTTFFAHTLPQGGRLEGDLYLPADGNPTLGRPFYESGQAALEELADSLLSAGVTEVAGRLIIDVAAWDSTTVPESWMIEDLNGSPGATGGAFVLDRGELEIRAQGATRAGEPARVDWSPRGQERSMDPAAEPFVENRVLTVAAGESSSLRTSFRPESRRWIVEGTLEIGEELTLTRSARDPVRLAVAALERTLGERGIGIAQGTEILWDPGVPLEEGCPSGRVASCPATLRLVGLPSAPLSEVVQAILGPSQNWMTEQLVRTLGAERGARGSWDEGFGAMEALLASEAEVPPDQIYWEDGSGLSNHNLLSPRALVSILAYARSQPWGESFRSGLARPGLEDTTLESRLPGLRGRVFAKTGSLNHVNALSGYLVGEDGRELIFAILTNGSNLSASQMRARIDEVVGELSRGESVR